MPVQCVDCGHKFLVDAQHVVDGVGCDNCGGHNLERDQVSPTRPDGELRDMVDPISQEDQGGNPLGTGTIMGRDGERPPHARDNYMHSSVVLATDFGMFDFGDDAPSETHKFVITNDGQVFSLPTPTTHEEVADRHGIEGFPAGASLGSLTDDGNVTWYQHDSGLPSNRLAALVSDHFGQGPVDVGTVEPTTNEERWFGAPIQPGHPGETTLPNYWDRKLEEADAVQQRGRPYPYYDNPHFNRGGSYQSSRSLDMDPYLPWTHVAAPETFAPQNTGLTATVQPGPAGIHNGTIKWLRFFGATVNGLDARTQGEEIYARYGNSRSPEFGQPVEVAVHDPSHLPAVVETIQLSADGAQATPMTKMIGQAIQRGELPAPPGIDVSTQVRAKVQKRAFLPALMAIGGGLLRAAAPALMQGALRGVGMGAAMNLMNGGGQAQQPQEMTNPQVRAYPVARTADVETPSSVPEIGVAHDDPERVDQKEFNDGDLGPNLNNPNLPGEAGGSQLGEDAVRENAGFAPDSPGLERAELMLPLLLHYYDSDESGENDPLVRELHNILDQEYPGYLDTVNEDSEAALQELLQHRSSVTAAGPIQQPIMTGPQPGTQGVPAAPANTNPLNQVGQPQPGRCTFCGGTTMADGSCPQCGSKAGPAGQDGSLPPGAVAPGQSVPGPYTGRVAAPMDVGGAPDMGADMGGGMAPPPPPMEPPAEPESSAIDVNQQGPKTPEQISAVQQLLIEEGRIDEIPLVPIEPHNYARELAEVQNRPDNPPPNVEESAPPMPAMEETPPGAGMPMPAPPTGIQPMGRYAADNVAKRCPNCGSGTTGLVDEDGGCRCQSCGHTWGEDSIITEKTALREDENSRGVPVAERVDPMDDRDRDSSGIWKDTDGTPLQQGREYEMHNPSFRIPDIVRIEAIRPDGITVTQIGEYSNSDTPGLEYTHEISREQLDLEGITFVPSGGGEEEPEAIPSVADEERLNTEPVQQSVERMTSVAESSPALSRSQASGPRGDGVMTEESDDPACPDCGEVHDITSSMASPTSHFNECYRCGKVWETHEASAEGQPGSHLDWLMNDSGPGGDDFFAEMERARSGQGGESRNLASIAARDPRNQAVKNILDSQKTAGKRFSPSEQRKFIDEDGVARNGDLLDLEGTHYHLRSEGTAPRGRMPDSELVPDGHLALGI